MTPVEADPFAAPIKAAAAPAMALSSQPKEVAEDVQRQAQLRRVDKDIEHLMRARYPLIYILSSEEKRVEKSIADVLHTREREKNYRTKIYTWSVTEGVRLGKEPQGDSKDPLKALRFVVEAKPDERAVFILRDLHPFLKNPEVVRLLRDIGRKLKEELKTVFLISPLLAIPPELDKEVAVVEYPLPELKEIDAIFDRVSRNTGAKIPSGQEREHVVEAALGLTADEAEGVFAKSLVQTGGAFDIDVILSEKERIVRKSGVLEFFRTQEKMDNIGGLDVLKGWLRKRQAAFSEEARQFGLPRPKGILMIGIPGGGKSLTAKAVGAAWRLPLLRLDVGKIFAGIVGSSEENMRRAIQMAEAVAPSILWVDELEKGFSGTGSSNSSDAGTAARVFGSFITWLQEKTSPVFVIATANNVDELPPEMMRKGRFDEIFFVDLPTLPERTEIASIHLNRRGRNASQFNLGLIAEKSDGMTGAEIEQAVVSALFDEYDRAGKAGMLTTEGVVHSLQETVPLSRTMKEKIAALRNWCKTRARPASSAWQGEGGAEAGRKIEIDVGGKGA
ncbi:MAG TPA: AAA family ATPase [Myxococcales bacterium]|nr:AAA family ATPase [Myxococcales bacterium]